ncbi:auxilin-like clathrin-binding protein required for normal clathrin function [Basidiobolus ranarum]|uniref:Auxilin-like clathrin-binding protein required for normal clathrin function n=1 Tax=Basidiobolus ranarum TaxID=34480 RepID=A0ABR2WL83_9FUNG
MVEERLNQWKFNKVGNLRAMIASLDTILWPELNWKACGLQDLILPSQVKSKYIRAIAKLHPDKLSTKESVEHKLLASGIFSILNENWDQFKAQNGL